MIDGFHLFFAEKGELEEKLRSQGKIEQKGTINITTGFIENYPVKGIWKGIKFTITENGAYVEGSLHKFYNELMTGISQNYDDFSLSQISDAILGLKLIFGESLEKAQIKMLEIGFNLPIDISPEYFLRHNLLMYRFTEPNKNDSHDGKGFTKGFRRTDYRWKLYDKGSQYNLSRNILRIEMKFTGRRVLERHNIDTVADLTNTNKLLELFQFMLDEFQQLMIIDNFGIHLSKEQHVYLTKITNPHFWQDLRRLKREKAISDKILEKRKALAVKFLEDHHLIESHITLTSMLNKKYDLLTTI